MKAIIVDLELTQNNGNPKILEIGAVLVHTKTHEVLDVFSEITNSGDMPDNFITNLTGITQEMTQSAKSLREVLRNFWEWCVKHEVSKEIASWGREDYNYLIRTSKELGVPYPEKLECFDVSQIARIFRQGRGVKAKGGLKNTLETFGMQFEGNAHRAVIDSYNTARVLFFIEQTIEFAVDVEKRFGSLKVENDKECTNKFLSFKDIRGK